MASCETLKYSENMCVICCKVRPPSEEFLTNMRQKGIDAVTDYSIVCANSSLIQYLSSEPAVVKVHDDCRKKYCTKRRSLDLNDTTKPDNSCKKLRSTSSTFNVQTDCFLCGLCALADPKHPDRSDVISVRTIGILFSILAQCDKRMDEWSVEVKSRVQMYSDLCAADAIYHRRCHTAFYDNRTLPETAHANTHKVGRPVDEAMTAPFDQLCDWLQMSDMGLHTLQELREKLCEFAGCGSIDEVYTVQYLKEKLEKTFQEHIFFAEVNGRRNVVCFRDMASYIINEKWHKDRKTDIEEESIRIVAAAAKLIKAQIRGTLYSTDEYPINGSVSDVSAAMQWVPPLLRTFVENVVVTDLKQTAICHAIVQAARPRTVISPVLYGIGVSVDHVLGSKWLLNFLARCGFSVSYDEVVRYKQSVVQCDVDQSPAAFPASFTQWSGDNVDHNVNTLDGLGSLHGMGIISMSTPYSHQPDVGGSPLESSVPRMQRTKVANICKDRGIPIVQYNGHPKSGLALLSFKPYDSLCRGCVVPPSMNLELIWHSGWFFSDATNPRPNWCGFMQDISAGAFLPAADIRMLPIINLISNDYSCIFSTLTFVEQQARSLNIEVPCITFDQPLWLKSVDIVYSEKLKIVCRLGAFHTMMNFMGSIGTVMDGSGLMEALHCCYGPNTVSHMLTGKSVARALRSHLLTESALSVILLRKVFGGTPILNHDCTSDHLSSSEVMEMQQLYSDVLEGKCSDEGVGASACFQKVQDKLECLKKELSGMSRTAKLWIQYMQYVEHLKAFVRAERTGNWNLHLFAVSKMLNLFAATGHNNYVKSTRLYLQLMLELPDSYPWLHGKFIESGLHTVRRSNRFWAAISTDLAIEQVMMKSVKSRGGLTHGRGVTESVRLLWINSMHKCASVHLAMAGLTKLDHCSDEMQHVELGKSRLKRDFNDLAKLIQWFESNNPFDTNYCQLRSLSSGIAASDSDCVDCDIAEDVGASIMQSLDGLIFTDVALKRSLTVKTLADVTSKVKTVGKNLGLDSGILFSRLLVIMERNGMVEPYFKYELTALPTSLFKDSFIRKTDKSKLAKELIKNVVNSDFLITSDTYVLDGGCLLHRVKWLPGSTYGCVVQQYVEFIRHRYGSSDKVTIVFDGYLNGPTTKDHERERRGLKASPNVAVEENKTAFQNASLFLLNESNKKQFVALLCQALLANGFEVYQSTGDADTLIVNTALIIARTNRTVTVVADDTDVLVMLVYHFKSEMADIFMLSDMPQRRSGRKLVFPIRTIQVEIGNSLSQQLLVVHAISGCDTTSALFGFGKGRILKVLSSNKASQKLSTILATASTTEGVLEAGLQLLTMIYGGQPSDSLTRLRYLAYMNMAATSNLRIRPECLPPTENAAKYHILRVRLQVSQWMQLNESTELDPEDWGWKLDGGRYVPLATDLAAAPDDVLKAVRCGCKSSRSLCGTAACLCYQHGLKCVTACKHCNGETCENAAENIIADLSDDDDDGDDEVIITVDNVNSSDIPYECFISDIPWIEEEVINDQFMD